MNHKKAITVVWIQSYQTLISLFFRFLLLSLVILKHRKYFCMLQTLLTMKNRKKSSFYNEKKFVRSDSWGQFHQRSTPSFYVCKLRVQIFCAYILGLYFSGARLLAQKLRLEHWWNWALVVAIRITEVEIVDSFVTTLFLQSRNSQISWGKFIRFT